MPRPLKLEAWRTEVYGISQRLLARRAGLSHKTIVDIESGAVTPRASTVRKIADGLMLPSPFYLYEDPQPRLLPDHMTISLVANPEVQLRRNPTTGMMEADRDY